MNDVLKPFLLDGKVALVTGASSGFGEHFACVLAQAGAKVVLGARRTSRIEAACESIRQTGGEAIAVTMDVTDSASVKNAFDEAEKAFGLVNIIINNAGITIPKPLLDLTDDDWLQVIDTNLNGVMYVTREAGHRLVAAKAGGSIVNIASILAERVQKSLTNYAASKAAVVQFTKATALEFARYDIRVNALCPGYFSTELNGEWFKTQDGQALIQRIPQRRTGSLHELNGPLLLLASDAGSLMTGSTITIDGGHVLSDL
ncbi:MAG: NAD(P)-dependent dehydrogenase (short-subunit alcohol dehydrogenase family) [Halioglobus sp.]|jgi:NAD(P)-dependent dehydrogenase (short-subunit alcohol dehydrogenase family)